MTNYISVPFVVAIIALSLTTFALASENVVLAGTYIQEYRGKIWKRHIKFNTRKGEQFIQIHEKTTPKSNIRYFGLVRGDKIYLGPKKGYTKAAAVQECDIIDNSHFICRQYASDGKVIEHTFKQTD